MRLRAKADHCSYTTVAAPNAIPSRPQPASPVNGASTLATATAAVNPSVTAVLMESALFQADLKAREPLHSSFTVANSFTSLNGSLTLPGTAMLTSSASVSAGPIAVGSFTAADGGIYEVTSQSGLVVIDGKTLAPGQGALIGNEEVSDGAHGLMANGQTVALSTMTLAEAATTTAAPAMSTAAQSGGGASLSVSTTAAQASASSGSASAASTAASSSSAAAAAATNAPGKLVAAAGGLLGLMFL